MAVFETWLDQDLKKPVRIQYLSGNLFSQDNMGNLIGVNVTDDGAPATLGGSVSANVIRADGATVAVDSGVLSGNRASVTLPQAAYAVPGVITVVIKITSGTDVTTLAAVVTTVYRSSTDTVVDPGTIIPSIQALISQIETAVASIPSDYSSLWTTLAPAYSTSATYAVGQYVTYNGGLYRCTTAITSAESWTAAHWTAAKVGNDLSDLKSALDAAGRAIADTAELVIIDSDWEAGSISSSTGLPVSNQKQIRTKCFYPISESGVLQFNGVTTNRINLAVFYDVNQTFISRTGGTIPQGAYYVKFLYGFPSSASDTVESYGMQNLIDDFSLTYTSPVSSILNNAIKSGEGIPSDLTDLDNLLPNRLYLVSSNRSGITHSPYPDSAFNIIGLSAFSADVSGGNWQIAKRSSYKGYDDFCMRFKNNNGVWSDWEYYLSQANIEDCQKMVLSTNDTTDRTAEIQKILNNYGSCTLGDGIYYVNGLVVGENQELSGCGNSTQVILSGSDYANLFNFSGLETAWGEPDEYGVYTGQAGLIGNLPLVVSPQANTQYGILITMRNATPGTQTGNGFRIRVKFAEDESTSTLYILTRDTKDWVTVNIATNAEKTVESIYFSDGGQANDTIQLKNINVYEVGASAGGTAGTAITLKHKSKISNLNLIGYEVPISDADIMTDGGRIGLSIPKQCHGISVENCLISDFSGSGIYCVNDSTSVVDGSHFINLVITRCHVGLNFYDKFEYNRVSNCAFRQNYIGVQNNGGNNLFSNCGFNNNYTGFLIDNSLGNHSNTGHGSCVGCNFNHSKPNNTGKAIEINGSYAGFVFSGCSIFYGSIELIDCMRVIFDGLNAGNRVKINVQGGGLAIFNASSFRTTDSNPENNLVYTSANNPAVKFVACYNQSGTTVDPTVP